MHVLPRHSLNRLSSPEFGLQNRENKLHWQLVIEAHEILTAKILSLLKWSGFETIQKTHKDSMFFNTQYARFESHFTHPTGPNLKRTPGHDPSSWHLNVGGQMPLQHVVSIIVEADTELSHVPCMPYFVPQKSWEAPQLELQYRETQRNENTVILPIVHRKWMAISRVYISFP